jgi:hypothetical protein
MKRLFYFLILLSFSFAVKAEPVDSLKALTFAQQFFSQNMPSKNGRLTAIDFELVKKEPNPNNTAFKSGRVSSENDFLFYIFNVGDNNGFIIVAGDDASLPVLAYANEGSFDLNTDNPGVKMFLENYKSQLIFIKTNKITVTDDIKNKWDFKSNYKNSRVSLNGNFPLINTKWNQGNYYNKFCPTDDNGKVVTGCVATATAQVLKYHNYPSSSKGKGGYHFFKFGSTRYNEVSIDNESYDWNNMPNVLNAASSTTQVNAVSKLIYNVGVSVNMQYTYNSSGAYTEDVVSALINNFDYDDNLSLIKQPSTGWSTVNINSLKDELDNNRPIIFAGSYDQNNDGSIDGGHCFVLDAYDINGNFHINWGWGGALDGYFTLNNLNPGNSGIGSGSGTFNLSQLAIIGVKPKVSNQVCELYYVKEKAEIPSPYWYTPYAEFASKLGIVETRNNVFQADKIIKLKEAARSVVLAANSLKLTGYNSLSNEVCNSNDPNLVFVEILRRNGIINQIQADNPNTNVSFGLLCKLVDKVILGIDFPKAYRTSNYTKAKVIDNANEKASILSIINIKGIIKNKDSRNKAEYTAAGFKDATITGNENVTNALLAKIIANSIAFKFNRAKLAITAPPADMAVFSIGSENPDDYIVVGDKYEFNNLPFGEEIPQRNEPSITMKAGESKAFAFPDVTIGGLPVHLYWTVDGGTLNPNTGTFQSVTFKAPNVTTTKVLQLYYYAATSGGYAMESYREITVIPNNNQTVSITNNGDLNFVNAIYQSTLIKSTTLSLSTGTSFVGNARIVGTNASSFTLNTTNINLSNSITQSLSITFNTNTIGAKTASLEIYNNNGVVLAIPILGTVQASDACLSASVVSIQIQTGNTNTIPDYFFTLSNQSASNSMNVTSVQFTGADAQYFAYDTQLFSVPQSIRASLSTGFLVKTVGSLTQNRTYNATLTFTTDNPLCPTLSIPIIATNIPSQVSWIAPSDGYTVEYINGQALFNFQWQGYVPAAGGQATAPMDVQYTYNNGATWTSISSSAGTCIFGHINNQVNSNSQQLTDPNIVGKKVQFRISTCDHSLPWQYSGYCFVLPQGTKTVELLSPNGNEVYTAGEKRFIRWNDYVGYKKISLLLSADNNNTYTAIATDIASENGIYEWTVPTGVNSENCWIKIVANNVFDVSDNKFYIQTPPITPFNITSVTTTPEKCLATPSGSIQVNLTNISLPAYVDFYKADNTYIETFPILSTAPPPFIGLTNNLSSGWYKIVIKDANNKRQTTEAFVPLRASYGSLLYAVDDICSGSKGKVQVNITGNFPDPGTYTFFKNGTQIYNGGNPYVSNISEGEYKVNIVGADGCLTQEATTISSSPGTYFPITTTVTNTSCKGNTGTISLNVGTAQSPTYLWSNGATTQNLTALAAGQYSVNITDATGCVQTVKNEVFEVGGLVENILLYATRGNYNCLKINQGKIYFGNYRDTNDPLYSVGILDVNNNSFNSVQILSKYNSTIIRQPKLLEVTNTDIYAFIEDSNNGVGESQFVKINKSNNQIISRISIPGINYYTKIQLINGKLYALTGTTNIDIIDFVNNTASTFAFPEKVFNCEYNISDNKLYIVGNSPQLFEYDLVSNSITRIGAITMNRNYQINLVGTSLFITGFDNINPNGVNIESFDLNTFKSTGKTKIRTNYNLDYGRSFVKENRYLYLPSSLNYIDVFDTQLKTSSTIPMSINVYDVDYEPTNDKIFGRALSSSLIRLDNNKFDFTSAKTDATCGLSNGSITLTIPSDGKTYTYSWSNGATTKDISNLSAGDYTVTVTQTGGCSLKKTITIVQTSAAFPASALPNIGNICPNTTLSLVSSAGQSYIWYKDNVVISGAISQSYNASIAGNYKVVVTNSNNCTTTSNIIPITVIPNPVANFTFTVSGSIATFTNTSTNGNQYLWSFGDGTTDTQFSPIKTFSSGGGTYNVTLRTTNSCGNYNEITKAVTVSCTQMYTLKTGNWNDVTVWSCGRVPTSTDVITVKANHIITVPAIYTANAKDVNYETGGKISPAANTSKLCLSCPVIPTNGLVLYLPMDGNVNDASGNNNNGVVTGATLGNDRFGVANKSYRFNDGNNIRIPNSASLSITNAFTISVWVNMQSTTGRDGNGNLVPYGNHTLFAKNCDVGTLNWAIAPSSNGTFNSNVWAGNNGDYPAILFQLNTWKHLTITYDGTTLKQYVNGSLFSSKTVSNSFTTTNARDLYIGKMGCWYYFFNGFIDEFRMYNRGLSDLEVLSIYNGEKP